MRMMRKGRMEAMWQGGVRFNRLARAASVERQSHIPICAVNFKESGRDSQLVLFCIEQPHGESSQHECLDVVSKAIVQFIAETHRG